MKTLSKISFLVIFFLLSKSADAQILITLVFGDKLNSEKIEFGLVGGLNRSYIYDIDDSKGLNNFNLGFYFHFLMKNNSYLSTGVLVKSDMGATGMPTYSTGDQEFDEVFRDGTLTKEIGYFYVPILFQQRFYKRWILEAGFQAGLRGKANDYFEIDGHGGKVNYTRSVKDEYAHLDAGLLGGIGFKFRPDIKSMAIGINYYYGLVNVSSLVDSKIKNSAFYLYFKVPIGAEKKEKTKE